MRLKYVSTSHFHPCHHLEKKPTLFQRMLPQGSSYYVISLCQISHQFIHLCKKYMQMSPKIRVKYQISLLILLDTYHKLCKVTYTCCVIRTAVPLSTHMVTSLREAFCEPAGALAQVFRTSPIVFTFYLGIPSSSILLTHLAMVVNIGSRYIATCKQVVPFYK